VASRFMRRRPSARAGSSSEEVRGTDDDTLPSVEAGEPLTSGEPRGQPALLPRVTSTLRV
jgi:hypothetical protein